MNNVRDIAVIALCVGLVAFIVAFFVFYPPESAVEAPVSPVEAVSPEPVRTYQDDLQRALERTEAVLERVERYLAEHDDPHAP